MANAEFDRDIEGTRLHVQVEGSGPPVLLLHGFPDSRLLWRHLTPRLIAAGYQTVAPDLRGFGLSAAPEQTADYDMHRIARDVIALLDEIGLRKVKLVGHDWGAVIGWLLAGRYPERFESFVAVSVGHPAAYASAGMEQKLKGWYVLAVQARGVAEYLIRAGNWRLFRRLVHDHSETPHWIADLARDGRLTAGLNWYRANFRHLLRPKIPHSQVPVLGIWSDGDIALAEDQMTKSQAYVDADWRYERLENVSHWIPLDAPDRLAELLLDFFQQHRDPFDQ